MDCIRKHKRKHKNLKMTNKSKKRKSERKKLKLRFKVPNRTHCLFDIKHCKICPNLSTNKTDVLHGSEAPFTQIRPKTNAEWDKIVPNSFENRKKSGINNTCPNLQTDISNRQKASCTRISQRDDIRTYSTNISKSKTGKEKVTTDSPIAAPPKTIKSDLILEKSNDTENTIVKDTINSIIQINTRSPQNKDTNSTSCKVNMQSPSILSRIGGNLDCVVDSKLRIKSKKRKKKKKKKRKQLSNATDKSFSQSDCINSHTFTNTVVNEKVLESSQHSDSVRFQDYANNGCQNLENPLKCVNSRILDYSLLQPLTFTNTVVNEKVLKSSQHSDSGGFQNPANNDCQNLENPLKCVNSRILDYSLLQPLTFTNTVVNEKVLKSSQHSDSGGFQNPANNDCQNLENPLKCVNSRILDYSLLQPPTLTNTADSEQVFRNSERCEDFADNDCQNLENSPKCASRIDYRQRRTTLSKVQLQKENMNLRRNILKLWNLIVEKEIRIHSQRVQSQLQACKILRLHKKKVVHRNEISCLKNQVDSLQKTIISKDEELTRLKQDFDYVRGLLEENHGLTVDHDAITDLQQTITDSVTMINSLANMMLQNKMVD